MIATDDPALHEEAWLALPFLANGRLSQAERDKLEPHVRGCNACREELAFQRLLCNVLTEPDRVTYAPGPSFRKLMDRIDSAAQPTRKPGDQPRAPASLQRARKRRWAAVNVSLWRPPGLAWAASFVLMVGFAGVFVSHWLGAPVYRTVTDVVKPVPNILQIAFYGTVTVGEAEEVLRSTGAHIVEGPDSVGVFGVAPDSPKDLRVLATRLHADPRVRWVEPIPGDDSPGAAEAQTSRGP